jgi:hypothetical protein
MAALARALSHVTGTQIDVDDLKSILIFSGVGLTISLLLACYGLDLGAEFF